MRMLRHALRSLRHSPGYTAACIAILALGIGANTAIFSLIDTTLLKPLPYPNADRLVYLWGKTTMLSEPWASRMPTNRPMYEAWQTADSFEAVGAFRDSQQLVEGSVERPRRLQAAYVSASLLPLLGARPELGRLFEARQEIAGNDRVVMLSDSYFNNRFHRDPAAIGKNVTLNGMDYTVIGVLPPTFHLAAYMEGNSRNKVEVYLPISRLWTTPDVSIAPNVSVVARRKPQVSLEQARTEANAVISRLPEDQRLGGSGANAFSFQTEDRVPGLDRTLYILLGAVALLLLIACSNLANLTLARAKGRTREVAVRLALGATRARIAAQLLLESLLVSVAGAAVGLFLAGWIIAGLGELEPPGLDRPDLGDFRWPVFAFTAGVGILVALLFGWLPAWTASRTSVNAALKTGGRSVTERSHLLRNVLTGAEVAIALMLVTGAGLLVRSVWNLFETGIGIKTDQLVFTDIELPAGRYPDEAKRARLFEELLEKVQATPGVTAVGITSSMPLASINESTFTMPGRPPARKGEGLNVSVSIVSPGFLETLGIALLSGRPLSDADVKRNSASSKGDGVGLINQSFADKYLPGENPLGKRLTLNERTYQIVGIVNGFRERGPDSIIPPQFFRAGDAEPNMTLALRTAVPVAAMTETLRKMIASLDKQLPPPELNRSDYYFLHWISDTGFQMLLLGAFAGLGLLLAMLGVFSVLAHSVASRTREFGVRLALGASPAGIGSLVATQSTWPLGLGVLIGLAGSFALSRFLESQLFKVNAHDPLVFTLAIVTVLLAAPFAIWLPVRRASRVECTEALREE